MIVDPSDLKSAKLDLTPFMEKVQPIINDVKERGDEALIDFTKRFDDVDLSYIRVPEDVVDEAYDQVDDELIDALEVARENIERFHYVTSVERDMRIDFDDVILGKKYVPLESAGIYVPGGRASYPSTALMGIIPASLAGVERIAVCTPPDRDGKVKPLTLVACDIAGADEIYCVGGAQAIAALAYGTESVAKVDKIAGPGNAYVTAAKLVVQKDVPIDMPAGPSEVLIIADETANPRFVAFDALAQLEHDPLAMAIVLTTSRKLGEEVESIARREGAWLDLKNLRIAIVESVERAVEISNSIAPEHLVIMCEGGEMLLNKVRHAGSVFIGEYSPVAAGDYASGTNHILPTSGFARNFGGVSVETFLKHITYQIISPEGLKRIGEAVIKLAESEGMLFHKKSVEERLK
jgi:histidinol dehydrogenase